MLAHGRFDPCPSHVEDEPVIKEIVFPSSDHTFAHLNDLQMCEGGHQGMDLLLCQEYVELLKVEFANTKIPSIPADMCCICYFGG